MPVGPAFDDPVAEGVEVLLGRHPPLVGRVERAEHVVLTPHHTLGHAGRATGVEQEQMIAAADPTGRRCGRGDVRPSSYGVAQVGHGPDAVVDPEPQPDAGHAVPDRLDVRCERAVEDDGDHVGVVPQVHELVGGVSVVRVDGRQAGLEAGVARDSTYSGQLWRYCATLSCSRSPAPRSAAAMPSARRSKSAQVKARSPCCCASSSGIWSAIDSNTSAKFQPRGAHRTETSGGRNCQGDAGAMDRTASTRAGLDAVRPRLAHVGGRPPTMS